MSDTVFARGANVVGLHGIQAHWPEATVDTFRSAPPEVVVAALLDKVERYKQVIADLNEPRRRAEAAVDRLTKAAREVLEIGERPLVLELGEAS